MIECSVQEAVYHILSELWLLKIFPEIMFLNSNMPESGIGFLKGNAKLMSSQKLVLEYSNMIC